MRSLCVWAISIALSLSCLAPRAFAADPNCIPHWKEDALKYQWERAIVSQARTVAAAAERFAWLNNGIYPSVVYHFQSMLPQGMLITNAVYGVRTEPVDGHAATPGQIAYAPISLGGYNRGGTITAFGRTHTIVTIGIGVGQQLLNDAEPLPSIQPEDREPE